MGAVKPIQLLQKVSIRILGKLKTRKSFILIAYVCLFVCVQYQEAYSLLIFCRPIMKEHMKYIIEHAEEIEKLIKVKAQVSEVKSIMLENLDKVNDIHGDISKYPGFFIS